MRPLLITLQSHHNEREYCILFIGLVDRDHVQNGIANLHLWLFVCQLLSQCLQSALTNRQEP